MADTSEHQHFNQSYRLQGLSGDGEATGYGHEYVQCHQGNGGPRR